MDENWQFSPLKEKEERVNSIAAVEFNGSILLFGGEEYFSYLMYGFSEEG